MFGGVVKAPQRKVHLKKEIGLKILGNEREKGRERDGFRNTRREKEIGERHSKLQRRGSLEQSEKT